MDLLPSELDALNFINAIGLHRAHKLLNKVCNRMSKRADRANAEATYSDFCYTAHYLAKAWELSLRHKLEIGITLVDNSNTPYAAHQRILERIAKRKERLKMRKKEAG